MNSINSKGLVNSNNLPLLIAILGLISSMIVAQINISANRNLEEKKLESALLIAAINTNDPIKTKNNIAFLIKAGLMSEERQRILTNLSDSLSQQASSNFLTSSDSAIFYDFKVIAKDKELFQGNSLITFQGLGELANLKFQSFTDNTGKVEFSFPSIFMGKTFFITIEKNGYRTISYEYTFPPDMISKTIIPYKEITLTQ